MRDFDALIEEFLASPKVIKRRWRWRSNRHDYARAVATIEIEGRPTMSGRLYLVYHLTRTPEKYSLTLSFKGTRVFSFDAEPGRSHFSASLDRSVTETHWHIWPKIQEVIPDQRIMFMFQWLDEFFKRARIDCRVKRAYPRKGFQGSFSFDG